MPSSGFIKHVCRKPVPPLRPPADLAWLPGLQVCAPLWALSKAFPYHSTATQSQHRVPISKVRPVAPFINIYCTLKEYGWLMFTTCKPMSRDHHVHRLTVRPTWETSVMHKRLKGRPRDFQIELMDGAFKDLYKGIYICTSTSVFTCQEAPVHMMYVTLRCMEQTTQVQTVPAWKHH